eukprot:420806_1
MKTIACFSCLLIGLLLLSKEVSCAVSCYESNGQNGAACRCVTKSFGIRACNAQSHPYTTRAACCSHDCAGHSDCNLNKAARVEYQDEYVGGFSAAIQSEHDDLIYEEALGNLELAQSEFEVARALRRKKLKQNRKNLRLRKTFNY